MALFFTGRNHAGENLARVFVERAQGLSPPIQMSDCLVTQRAEARAEVGNSLGKL